MRRKKKPKSKFKLTVRSQAVSFWIDHQGFTLHIEHDEEEMPRLQRNRWFAKQLRIALKRLQGAYR